MILNRVLFQTLLAISMSVGVTAGSVYVTVSAAANNNVASVDANTAVPTAIVGSTSSSSSVTVELSADGGLNGRLSSIETSTGELDPTEGVRVSLIAGSGESLNTTSREDGTFSFDNVSPGVYTVQADSPKGRLAYGIRAIRSQKDAAEASSDAKPVSITLSLQLDFGLAPAQDTETLDTVIQKFRTGDPGASAAEQAQADTSDSSYVQTGYEIDLSEASIGHEQLRLNEDGSLDGHVTLLNPKNGNVAPVNDLTVSFIRKNKVVATTSVNVDGSFSQENLAPGVYTFVVAGRDGIAYMGVDVAAGDSGEFLPTAARQGEFETGVVGGGGASMEESTVVEEYFVPGAIGGGGVSDGGGFPWPLLLLGGIPFLFDDDNGVASPRN